MDFRHPAYPCFRSAAIPQRLPNLDADADDTRLQQHPAAASPNNKGTEPNPGEAGNHAMIKDGS